MEMIPLSIGYRKELTFRFRLAFFALFVLIIAREYFRRHLHLELGGLPLEAIWHPPRRNPSQDSVALVEVLNYCYAFLFVVWIRDGVVLSLDFVGLRIRDALWNMRRRRQALGHS